MEQRAGPDLGDGFSSQTHRFSGMQKVMKMRHHYVEDEEMIPRFMSLFG